jgi:hypothetical protein
VPECCQLLQDSPVPPALVPLHRQAEQKGCCHEIFYLYSSHVTKNFGQNDEISGSKKRTKPKWWQFSDFFCTSSKPESPACQILKVLKETEAAKNFFTQSLTHFSEIVNLFKSILAAIPNCHNSLLPRLYSMDLAQ